MMMMKNVKAEKIGADKWKILRDEKILKKKEKNKKIILIVSLVGTDVPEIHCDLKKIKNRKWLNKYIYSYDHDCSFTSKIVNRKRFHFISEEPENTKINRKISFPVVRYFLWVKKLTNVSKIGERREGSGEGNEKRNESKRGMMKFNVKKTNNNNSYNKKLLLLEHSAMKIENNNNDNDKFD